METKESNLEKYVLPKGVVVKMSANRIMVIALFSALILGIMGGLFFYYVWGEASSDRSGFEVFSLKGNLIMILCIAGYILLQYMALYCFSGRDYRVLRWNMDWKSWGFLLTKPLALKYYRIVLLLPFFVLGLLPVIHGFCTGNRMIYFIGIFCILCSSGDCYYFWQLSSFDDNDKIVDGERSYDATIIKGTY